MPTAISPSGVSTAFRYGTQVGGGIGYTNITGALPPNVNTPIFFEPPCQLSEDELLLWIVITGIPPNFGGAQVWASVDGTSYGQIGLIGSGATQGVLTATFPSGSDPDTVNTLSVSVAQSTSQTINPGATVDADLGITLAYVNGSTPELIGYTAATLTSPANYNLDTYIRRGLFGTPISSHSSGANFALLNGGVFRYIFAKNLKGQTIHFKFPTFNPTGGELQELSAVTDYTYTLTGAGVNCAEGVKCRTLTAGASTTLLALTDYLLVVAKTVGSATTVNGPTVATVVDGLRFEIEDAGNGGVGDSDANPITFTPAGGVKVNNDTSYVLQSRGGAMVVTYCTSLSQWKASTRI